MFSAENFKFFTKKERIAREKDYENKIFHLGEGHKELVEQMLNHLYTETVRKDKEKMFVYVSIKQILLDKAEDQEQRLKTWYSKAYFLPIDKKRVFALVLLENDIQNIDDYPSVQRVLQRAQQSDINLIGD